MATLGNCAVIDIGKTTSRLSVFDAGQVRWAEETPTPAATTDGRYPAVDVDAIWAWLESALRRAARAHAITAVIPVGHGATAALLDADGRLAAPVMDYEADIPEPLSAAYTAARPTFEETGSPDLPAGLNLGRQLAWLEALGVLDRTATIVPYPQYWAARLCGVAASDVSSLGCHTDLWAPHRADFSSLAVARGWAAKVAPVRPAVAVLGPILPSIATRTGLPERCRVHCGAHDSNAALAAVTAIERRPAGAAPVVITTGTWSIAFAPGRPADRLDPDRDTLVNVGVDGTLIPSARFMGGREFAAVCGTDPAPATWQDLSAAIARQAMATPGFTGTGGPFPGHEGRLIGVDPADAAARRAVAHLYLALMWDTMLGLIAPGEAEAEVIIEGPAATPVLAGLLAALRPSAAVHIAPAGLSPSLGGAILAGHGPGQAMRPEQVTGPAALSGLAEYRANWRTAITATAATP